MQRFLIPLFLCLAIGAPSILFSQEARNISLPPGPFVYPPSTHANTSTPDFLCNFAGTFTLQQFIGHSNDTDLPQIFLCAGDSLLVRHNGDAILAGDPNPATPPGVAFAYYSCPPTIIGDNLQAIGTIPGPGDPCILKVPPPTNGLYITPGILGAVGGPAGSNDTWFYNNGGLINTFGFGSPVSIFFAPITLDEIQGTAGYESASPGAPPGPCVNVNTNAAFEVVYLNAIRREGQDSTYGNDCIGKFTVRGGYPEYNSTAIYTVSIVKTNNPNVKAIIHTPKSQLFHLAPVIFSVPEAGQYTITIEDGKACPLTFTMNMAVCDPSDNLVLDFPDTIALPATNNFCVPVTVENFQIISGSFSFNWDPNVLQYVGLENVNPALDPFTGSTLNDINSALGQIGLVIYHEDVNDPVINIPNGEVLFNACFNVIGTLGQCTGLNFTNSPTGVGFEDEQGVVLAFTGDSGSVCIQYRPLDVQIEIIDTTCLGTASMRVTATGGISPFEYDITVNPVAGSPVSFAEIQGSGSSYTFTPVGNFNNIPIIYSVCVVDSNGLGNSVCDTIEVYIPTLGAQINFVQQPSCNGDDDGILSAVVIVGGVALTNPGPQYTYQWSPSTPDPATPVQDGSVNGGIFSTNYTLIIRDNQRNCASNPAQGFLGQPLPISEEVVTVTPASCSGVANGSISYEVEGGTPFADSMYNYVWADENNNPVGTPGMANPIVLTGVTSGTYYITITDSKGCTHTDSVDVTDLRSVTINQGAITNVTCFGLTNGSATVTVIESMPTSNAFNFTWVPTPPPPCTPLTFNKASSYNCLAPGNYFITAQDPDGCKDTITITITQPLPFVLDTLGMQSPGCGQPNSGSLSVVATGGSGLPSSFAYNWDIPGSSPGPVQTGLPVGIYTVTATDANSCKDTLSLELTPPAPLSYTIDSIPVKCGADGSLTANAPSAVLFNWVLIDNGSTVGATSTITGLQGGTYAVTITDEFSCSASDTITLTGVVPMSFADTTFSLPLCYGSEDGSIGVTVQDGQLPYVSYNWTPAPLPNTPNISGIGAGTYGLTVTDNVGCTLTGSFTLDQPAQIINTITGVQDVSCFGVCDGTAQVASNYATTPPSSGTFTYTWSDGLSTDAARTDLCAGAILSVTSTDVNGCSTTDTIDIGSPSEITAIRDTVPATCYGLSNGSATVTPSGGNGAPYTYLWSDPASTVTQTASNLAVGEYVVTITDSNGCTSVIDSIYITAPGQIIVAVDPTQTKNPLCADGNTGVIVVTVSGGNAGTLQYEWSDQSGFVDDTQVKLDTIGAGIYSVVVTDSEGCTGGLTDITLTDPLPVQGDYEDPELLVCNGDVTILNVDTIFGGSGSPYQFSLDFGALLDPGFPVSLSGGDHTITYFDAKGCFSSEEFTVPEPAPIEVTFNPTVIEIELGDTSYQLKPLITGATPVTITWTPLESLQFLNGDQLNPYVYTFESEVYTLVIADDKGCTGSGSVTVNVDPNRNVYIPNIFKPGVGGLNDHFNVILGLGVRLVNYMRVYDRWGELMYSREKFLPDGYNYADGWDGRFNGDYVNPGVFVYIIEVTFQDGRVLLYRGDVTVVR